MGKYKYLLKNVGLMTINNFGSKILSFLLVPLYTSVLTTEEYGTYDLYAVTIFLLTPILSLNIIEALLRFSLDKNNEKKEIFSITIKYYAIACTLCCCMICLNNFLDFIPTFREFSGYFILYFALSLLSDLMTQFTRGLERLFDVAVSGIISSLSMLVMNILMLLVFRKGLEGYFIAYCTSFAVTAGYLFIRVKAWKYISFLVKNRELEKDMKKYSMPMILNSIGWWVNNAADKYVVIWMCGTAVNGVFSVAYKIPSLLTMFQTIFNQAWTISAVKEFDENSGRFYANIYRLYNMLMVFVCSVLLVFNKVVAKILFAKDFYQAWRFAPYLTIAVVFSSLSILLGGIFAASKNSKVYGTTTMLGAIVNIVCNVFFTWKLGAVGAAFATMISNIVVWACRYIEAQKIIKMEINVKRDIISYVVLNIQALIMLIVNSILLLVILELGCVVFSVLLYRADIGNSVSFVKSKLIYRDRKVM